MAINPENITTIRVDQLNSIGLTLESLFPHTNGTELTSSSIGDLATLVATTIESLNGIGFLPISVTDGQQLPDLPENPVFFLAGAGTYLNVNGFPDLICTENLNAIMSVTDHWEIAVEIPVNPLTGSVQSVTGSAVDNTDPLNPIINLSSSVTSVNSLTGAVVLDGDNIDVTDPTTSTDQTLNDALANIYASGGGATPDLQAVTDVGNSITDGTDTNTVSAGSVVITDGSTSAYYGREFIELTDGVNGITVDPSSINVNGTIYLNDKITIGAVNYPLPTGASSQIATLADITVGVGYTVVNANLTASNDTNYTVVANATFTDPSPTEGKGYVVYVRNGTATIGGTGYAVGSLVFRVFHSGAWSTREYKSNLTASDIPSGIDAVKIADGSVSNTEFQYLDGVTSSIQNQINSKQDKTTVFKNTTQTVVTGTTSETIIYAEEVLANSIADNTILSFKSRISRGPRVGTCALKLYINTVNNLSGTPNLIAQVTVPNNIGYNPFVRESFFLKNNTLTNLPGSSNSLTDIVVAPIMGATTYNINTTYYWILTAQPNTSTDSLIHNFSILEKN